jgi:hypothetical protein
MEMHVLSGFLMAASSSGDSAGNFFTGQSLGTFAGASFGVTIVGNTLRRVSGRELIWAILLISILFAYVAAEITGHPHSLVDLVLILLNGCLLFCTALGINETLVSAKQQADNTGKPKPQAARTIGWVGSWLPAS